MSGSAEYGFDWALPGNALSGTVRINVTAPDGAQIGAIYVIPDPAFGGLQRQQEVAAAVASALAVEHQVAVAHPRAAV